MNRRIHPEEVLRNPASRDVEEVSLRTGNGDIGCIYHPAADGEFAILWVFGAGGGTGGPAGGLYDRLARELVVEGIASLRLDYRFPGDLVPCVQDTLAGIGFLNSLGRIRVTLVGHSFGGAVAIAAGVQSESVNAVAALSSQTYGAEAVAKLSPRPLLLMHGKADEVLPYTCSEILFRKAHDPKQLLLYEGCRHGLDECRSDVDHDLLKWIRDKA